MKRQRDDVRDGLSRGSAPDQAGAPADLTAQGWLEGLHEMEGLGKECWTGIDPDEFVRKLREGWE